MRPITPSEAAKQKKVAVIPDDVIEVVNQLITAELSFGQATVKQEDIVKALVKKGHKSQDIFDNGWLNIEGVYRTAGWKVEYDKPAYCENYPATFKFTRKRPTC